MLISVRDLESIARGRVTVAFRRWIRPTVRSGGTLRTAVGVLAIESVEPVVEAEISASDAVAAGFSDVSALFQALNRRTGGTLYRVRLRLKGADPRAALRNQAELSSHETESLQATLTRLDNGSRHGAWTVRTLETIRGNPGCRAADLAVLLGRDKDRLKVDIRKLKELGLTESLDSGYRLSPRGEALLRFVARGDA